MIKIYNGWAEDFTGLGMGVLDPSECKIEEEAGGMYELELKQPMDEEHRDWMIEKYRIIKAPAPVRESPEYELAATRTKSAEINREIWVVTGTSVGVRLRTGPGTGYKSISTHKDGTELIVLEKTNTSWYNVCLVKGGATGYMSTKYMKFLRNEVENIEEDTPGSVLVPQLARNQLFRIYDTKRKSKARMVEVLAQHITYDLKGVTIKDSCNLEKVPANEAIEQMLSKQDREHGFEIKCECADPITADYTGRNWIDCLLNADDGIVAQCKARIIRDNYTIHILPGDQFRDLGAEIRYGKNMLDAELEEDCADVVTRIRPVGKKKDGEPLYGDYVDSPNIDKYPVIYTKDIEYDVQVGQDDIKNETQAKEKLKELAKADFDAGVDLPITKVDAGFVREELTEEYKNIANEQALHMYDVARVRDSDAGIKAKLKMTWYKFDCLLEAYEGTETGELTELEPTVYGYEIGKGSISGYKIQNGTIDGNTKLRDVSIGIAKIAVAAIEQLSANSITALTARLQEIIAGSITSDELYVALAEINKAVIKSADIDWADIENLVVEIAKISNAEIGVADISWAQIKDLVTGTAIITEGVGGKLMISRLAVTEANMVSLTTGELVVKGENGSFYSVSVDADGNIKTTLKQIENNDVKDLSINAGEKIIEGSVTAACLNATDIFADNATIRRLMAANLDVDVLFSREAFISKLITSNIVGDKNLTIIAGEATDAKATAEQTQSDLSNAMLDWDSTKSELSSTQHELDSTKTSLSGTQTDLANTKTSLSGTQTDLANTKTSLSGTQQDLANTQNDLNATKNDLSNTQSDLAATQNDLAATKDKIDNLQIGGRNLFTNTQDFSGSVGSDWNYALSHWTTSAETYLGFTVKEKSTAWDGLSQPTDMAAGEEYTLSAWIKRSEGATVIFYCEDTDQNGASFTEATGTAWTRISITFHRNSDGSATPRFENSVDGQTLYICGMQLERGNIVTDWTPAPQDSEEEIIFATPYDSVEPPDAAPAAGKVWIDRGTTPPIFRRWKGLNVSTEREYTGTSCENPFGYWNDGEVEGIESLVSTFTYAQASGTPGTNNPIPVTGITAATLWLNGELKRQFQPENGATMYGGEIDWTRGTWLQTHYAYVLTGDETFSVHTYGGGPRWEYAPADARASKNADEIACSHFQGSSVPLSGNNSEDEHVSVHPASAAYGGHVFLRCDRFANEAEFKAWRKAQYEAGTPVTIVFPLATPILHSFEPAQIAMIEGWNSISADRQPWDGPALTLETDYTCSGWETINSAEDIRSVQQAMQLQQSNAQAAIDELRTAVAIDNEGVHVRKVDNNDVQLIQNEVLITQKDVNIVSGGMRNSTFGSGYVRLLDMIIRVSGGGLVIEAAN